MIPNSFFFFFYLILYHVNRFHAIIRLGRSVRFVRNNAYIYAVAASPPRYYNNIRTLRRSSQLARALFMFINSWADVAVRNNAEQKKKKKKKNKRKTDETRPIKMFNNFGSAEYESIYMVFL
jgi:hypothetical protein